LTVKCYFSDIWIGLNDIETEGTFVWDYSGATFDVSKVGQQVKKNSERFDCVYYDGNFGFWYAQGCGIAQNYMCETSLCE
jgi:hypothetical protein